MFARNVEIDWYKNMHVILFFIFATGPVKMLSGQVKHEPVARQGQAIKK